MVMVTMKATVENGRIVVDVDYPDGTEVIVSIEEEEPLDEEEQAALHAALAHSWEQAKAGQCRPLEDILAELKATR